MALRALAIVVTTDCNLRCRYCYLARKRPGRAAWPVVRAALDLALRSAGPSLRLSFTGGEPLLQFPLLKRAVEYVEMKRDPEQHVRYVVTTNGTLLEPRQAAFLEKHAFEVNLSFDGVPDAQARRGADTFRQLDSLLERLRRDTWALFDRQLNVVVTATPTTTSFLADSFDYFLSKRVRTVKLSPAMRQRRWRLDNLDDLDRQFQRLFESARRHYENTGEVPLATFRSTSHTVDRPPALTWLCRAPTGDTLALDVDGTLYGCLLATRSYQDPPVPALGAAAAALRIGRAADPEFAEKLAGMPDAARACGLFQHPERRYSSYRRCADCEFMGECRICPFAASRGAGASDVDRVPDFLCAFNQVALKYARLFPRQPDGHELLTGQAPMPRLVRELLDNARVKPDARSN